MLQEDAFHLGSSVALTRAAKAGELWGEPGSSWGQLPAACCLSSSLTRELSSTWTWSGVYVGFMLKEVPCAQEVPACALALAPALARGSMAFHSVPLALYALSTLRKPSPLSLLLQPSSLAPGPAACGLTTGPAAYGLTPGPAACGLTPGPAVYGLKPRPAAYGLAQPAAAWAQGLLRLLNSQALTISISGCHSLHSGGPRPTGLSAESPVSTYGTPCLYYHPASAALAGQQGVGD